MKTRKQILAFKKILEGVRDGEDGEEKSLAFIWVKNIQIDMLNWVLDDNNKQTKSK